MDKTGAPRGKSGSAAALERGTAPRDDGRPGSGSSRLLSAGSPAAGGRSRGSSVCGSGVCGNGEFGQQAQRRHLEGVLSKYTNLLQGWQNRYFVLDPEQGRLQYYINEQGKGQKPRGSLPLLGATVDPSDEAPHMFTVHSASGEFYKLRAADAGEQQFWMNHLQASARRHSDSSARVGKLKGFDEHLCVERTGGQGSSSSGRARSFSLLPAGCPSAGIQKFTPQPVATSNIVTVTHHKSPAAARRVRSQYPGRLLEVKEVITQVEGQQRDLVQSIESLPAHGPVSCLDQDLLLLKATSTATLGCLGECLSILQRSAGQAASHTQAPGVPSDELSLCPGSDSPSTASLKSSALTAAEPSVLPRRRSLTQHPEFSEMEPISLSEELTDTEDNEEEDLGVMEEHRSVILHLLSQLKLGMDLTRVVLPTFILEKRSLLEMYANFMAHPEMFLAITAATSAEDRMVRFVEYYLTAFHEGRRGAVARKPYNPLLGETFYCSWKVPCERVGPPRVPGPTGCYHVRFVAEQVSHHPPVSGFYCECRERGMCVNAHIWTKSKFMGMSIGVSMVGEGVLSLLEHGEEYVFTLPSAYARSILTVPWVELAGKVSISCAKSGYSAAITFHSKPFYGGKVHRLTAEVKHTPTGTVVCKAQGEWNGTLEFTYSSGDTRVIDTITIPVTEKKIRPLEKQGPSESRRLWQHVTEALKKGDLDAATEHKRHLEEKQRAEERQRDAAATPWMPRHFHKEGEGWVYHNPLWKAN
ncbi:oxysterol-binding protein-related protein 10-like [Arapaima gigas]